MIAEVAARARTDEREMALRRMLARCTHLPADAATDFDTAATIYRRCRRVGITPRGLLDCMIGAVAMRYDVPVLAHDADFSRLAEVVPLVLDDASLRP